MQPAGIASVAWSLMDGPAWPGLAAAAGGYSGSARAYSQPGINTRGVKQ